MKMNYGFEQKNLWRNRIWNLLEKRVKVHPRDAVILYLAAEQDLDRETAIRKGFRENNLIAVDRDPEVVASIRDRGRLAICGDIFEVIRNWPRNLNIAGVIADFTCGLERCIINEIPALMKFPHALSTVWIINLQRGRDQGYGILDSVFSKIYVQDVDKHRAKMLRKWILFCAAKELQKDGKMTPELIKEWAESANFLTGTYRSSAGNLYFDWLVFNNPWGLYIKVEEIKKRLTTATSRSITAVLAHRTRRAA